MFIVQWKFVGYNDLCGVHHVHVGGYHAQLSALSVHSALVSQPASQSVSRSPYSCEQTGTRARTFQLHCTVEGCYGRRYDGDVATASCNRHMCTAPHRPRHLLQGSCEWEALAYDSGGQILAAASHCTLFFRNFLSLITTTSCGAI